MDRPREAVGKILVLLCFAALLALGIAIHRDYGYSIDEDSQRETGAMTVKHVLDRLAPALVHPVMNRLFRVDAYPQILAPLNEYDDKDYGVAFEAPLVFLEVLFGFADTQDVFLFRHLLTFLVCLGGAYALYCLALRRFADRWIGLLAVAFLMLSPRLFADSFYNSKDAVFMAACVIALNTTISFVLQPRYRSAVLHALATAFAIDIRIAAIMIPAATIAILAVRAIKREVPPRRTLSVLAIYLAATVVFVVALWPWLWFDPLARFGQALAAMSRFRLDVELLYMGAFVSTTNLPWHYSPVWLSITTPPLYLALFVVGTITTGWQFTRSGLGLWKDEAELQDLVFLGMFVMPVVAVILLNSVLYDGWRQLYFIYPTFLLVALKGWHTLWTLWSGAIADRVRRPALVAITAICLVATATWMIRVHPLQNVYFNSLAGANLKVRYELDYWGLSVRRTLEYLLANDPGEFINVREINLVGLNGSLMLLTPEQRQRLKVTKDESTPHYALLNSYRKMRETDDAMWGLYELFHEIKVDGEVVLSVFKRKPPYDR